MGVGPITESDVELGKSFNGQYVKNVRIIYFLQTNIIVYFYFQYFKADLVTFGLGESKAEARMAQQAGLYYTSHSYAFFIFIYNLW